MRTRNTFVYAVVCTLAATFWLSTAEAGEKAGTVIALKGEVSAQDASSVNRELKKDDPVSVGDTIHTGSGSYVIIEFIDGARATIRPDSELKVDQYAYGTGSDGAVMSLVKGGLRAITGSIAHENPESYKVKTNVATLGVRGTEFALRLCEEDCSEEAKRYEGITQGLEMNGDFIVAR
ncbi:MAG: FecR domain-containing protein [Arenicellales bacterium]